VSPLVTLASKYSICLSNPVNFSFKPASLPRHDISVVQPKTMNSNSNSNTHFDIFTKRIEEVCNFLNVTGYNLNIFSIGPILLRLFLKCVPVSRRHDDFLNCNHDNTIVTVLKKQGKRKKFGMPLFQAQAFYHHGFYRHNFRF